MGPNKYAAEAALVEALRNDEPGSWERYKQHCGDFVVKLIGTMLVPSGLYNDVADIHQEALLKALATWDGQSSSFKTWLTRIAGQLANNHLRKVNRRRENLGHADTDESPSALVPDFTDDEIDRIELESQSHHLKTALRKLPDNQRRAVVMRYYLGWETRDIARTLNLAESTVRVYIARALEALRATVPKH